MNEKRQRTPVKVAERDDWPKTVEEETNLSRKALEEARAEAAERRKAKETSAYTVPKNLPFPPRYLKLVESIQKEHPELRLRHFVDVVLVAVDMLDFMLKREKEGEILLETANGERYRLDFVRGLKKQLFKNEPVGI